MALGVVFANITVKQIKKKAKIHQTSCFGIHFLLNIRVAPGAQEALGRS